MYSFTGRWITDGEFASLPPRNVFHRQLGGAKPESSLHRDRHILFRKAFVLENAPESAALYFSADDCCKVYINGEYVSIGPAPSYHFSYGYCTVDVARYLRPGRNVIAFHTLYQGLINRVWVSGDQRHGLICDLVADGKTVVSSDADFLTKPHSGFSELGTVGYETQFLEGFDSRAPECGFEQPDFDDSAWVHASERQNPDWTLVPQTVNNVVIERVEPSKLETIDSDGARVVRADFGAMYVGYLRAYALGKSGEVVTVRCGQELNPDGSVRWKTRANCNYEETWTLSGSRDSLDWFDYKSFRYAEFTLPDGCELHDIALDARHCPFELRAAMRPEFASDEKLRAVWELCVRSQKYGVQEVIQDCMEREKGFYVGDGCYTALTHMLLTRDDSIVRKLIDNAFASAFITDGTVTCLDCSFMQEIAEYPLMLVSLVLWHYRLTCDADYLARNYPKVTSVLDAYRRDYERGGLLGELDKWCVVDWPANFRDGYDVDITEGKVCHEPHIALNAYYIEAVRNANLIAKAVGKEPYRDVEPLISAFTRTFYDPERRVFRDSAATRHASLIGNVFAYAFMLCPDSACESAVLDMLRSRGISEVSFFGAFAMLEGFVRRGLWDDVRACLACEGAWLRMLREGATATFEGWGRDTKWNTSLFHLTMSDAAVFLSDADLEKLFDYRD